MELRPGHKQTEAGVVPEDWRASTLGDETDLLTGFPFASSGYSQSGIRLVRGSNVKRGEMDWDESITEHWPQISGEITRYQLRQDDVVVAMDGALVGRSYAVIGKDDVPSLLLQRVARIRSAKVEQRLIAAWIGSAAFERHVDSVKTQTAIPHISPADIRSLRIAVPQDRAEQSAIVTAQIDADALLSALDALIAKQRAIKQGAMQELLTGKRRLPGFAGEWEMGRLGDALTIRHGKSQAAVASSNGAYPILATGGQIGTATEWLYDKPSVLIGRKGTINQPQFMDTPFWTVDTLFYSEMKGTNNAKFFYYRFCLIDWMQYNEASGVPSLNARTIEAVEVAYPGPEEQSAIAEVLGDMDAQISALVSKREKNALLKQGMMRELLTGRIRLLPPAAVSVTTPAAGKIGGRRANVHFMRSVLAAELIDQLYNEPTFGHVKFEKLIFLTEHLCKGDTGSNYHRDAAGPYDNRALRSIDSQLKKQKWFEAEKQGSRYQYVPLEKHGGHKEYFDRYYAGIRPKLDEIISTFRTAKTEQCEIVATLYGAWDDLLKQGKRATDDAIVDQVLNHWHDDKKRIEPERWHKALDWMRERGFAPEGSGPAC